MECQARCWGSIDDVGCSQGPLTWDLLLLVDDLIADHWPQSWPDGEGEPHSLPDR